MPREVNFEFFDKEPRFTVFQMFSLMGWRPFLAIKEKIGLKEGDFKRYSTKEPISMEAYSHDKAIKKITEGISGEFILGQLGVNERLMAHVLSQMILPKAGTSNDPSNFDIFLMWCGLKGWEPDLAFIILNHMKDTLAHPNVDLPYGLILNMSYRKIDSAWVKIGKPKSEPGEGTSKRKMNVKHGRQPPKTAGRSKSFRLLKKESPTSSSPIQVSDEDKATEEKPPQTDPAPVTSQPSATDPTSDQPDKPPSYTSPKFSASSPEPTPSPLTPLAEICALLWSLTAQVTTAFEELQELKTMVIGLSRTIGNAGHTEPSTATPSSAP
ncbi:hypothetical protein G2W53_007464 [Senna tora]|uniref:Uncharacterized protein n=1 Tax=Senna tora TaxID=362788 RepID=A0A835CHB3_9FABA|nr:hypothetical protein G2W53_007464 [Senna tora]